MNPYSVANLKDLGLDEAQMEKELDKVKAEVFFSNNSAFLAPLMCSMKFFWTTDIPTAAVDGVRIMWNPHFFLSLPSESRKTVLIHELWHPGRLHFLRRGNRDPKIWNYAGDIRINNNLEDERYSFKGIENCWKDQSYPVDMPEEDIYDDLVNKAIKIPTSAWGKGDPNEDPNQGGDLLPLDSEDLRDAINNVVQAIQQAKNAKQAGTIPGNVESLITKFLTPVVSWQQVLFRFFTDLQDNSYSWRRPNRRFDPKEIYLPSNFAEEGRLAKINCYEDVSGSITEEDDLRFSSELKYIWDTFEPKQLNIIQFDTCITKEITFNEGERFERLPITGKGGTSLVPVRQHIIDTKPTAVVVFSDLECEPMDDLPFDVPIIWIVINNPRASVPFGKMVHIRT